MNRLIAMSGMAVLALGTLPVVGFASNVSPPQVSATTGEPVSLRPKSGYEARCFRETTTRERGNWSKPTKTRSEHRARLEVRNGVEYLSVATNVDRDELKILLEMTPEGQPRKVPPLIETTIPGFEKEYGPALSQVVNQMMAGLTGKPMGQPLEIGKDYGPTMDVCAMLGTQSSGASKGTTVVEGTLTYSGRAAFLLTQTYEQTCAGEGVRFSVEGSAWAVHDRASGLAMSNAGQFSLFSQGTRFSQVDESMECGVAERK